MDPVLDAFSAVPREGFLPPGERGFARFDEPLPISHGQTNSQPRTVADMLHLLDVTPGDTVLDVGSGSGWTTALLAHLTGPEGSVVGVELEPDLVEFGRRNLAATGQAWSRIEQAEPGVLGWPREAAYDRILVSAEAEAMPSELVAQLAAPGRMVLPVAGLMTLVERSATGKTRLSEHGWYRFVPLRPS
ncbi:protein-L-isoaspartate(D-aspartate) O-methyltransferase [Nocardioides albertanoniae]|uniref:Protein-L-isoaspartate O-methyltransferase n=1 Tax=Nocardioides albertanoniae TaxID=1175486 RepID=A0A543ADW6_9ACTN|nr:protein-L-isoaspartate(D-aspartate) O-methyltransferase [Nocardioides albertanoniae]